VKSFSSRRMHWQSHQIIHHVGQVWMPRIHQFCAISALDIIPANELAEYEIANGGRRSTTFATTSFQRTFSYSSFDHWIWLSIGCARCLSSLILPFLAESLASSFAARYRSTERSGQIMHVPNHWALLMVNTPTGCQREKSYHFHLI
jgi:hypothetical protein